MASLPPCAAAAPTPAAAAPEIFQQLGAITRQLHDALHQLGVMPTLQQAAHGLPDARSRLSYIVRKTGEAADKVLNSVDQAKLEHGRITGRTRHMVQAIAADPVQAVASGALAAFADELEAAHDRIDSHLTDIMMAQDFHDLTGQVVAKVVSLASDLEAGLVGLLVQVAPAEQLHRPEAPGLSGPVVEPAGRNDVVANQGEVDDLLASLGF